ncbi:MAG: phenylacetate--CoA ligase family protein [Gemmatimonadetes bacterium]|nr:phenylacetate--CoA ligase family protein [Gemmatimonadota bacterium]
MTASRLDVSLWRAGIRAYEQGFKRRPVFRYWRELEASQWWSRERLESLQFERLQALLRHAGAHSPWYREAWASQGLDPASVQSPTDFHRWPVLDRETIRQHRIAMRSTPATTLITKATGGSSGVPLQFDLDPDSNERRMAAWHRGYGWAGAAPGTRQWYLWGAPPRAAGAQRRRKLQLYDALYRRTTESSFDLTEAEVPRLHQSLARKRPDAIVGYTGALYTFARLLEARGLVPFAPGAIVVGAEKLHSFQRTVIERVFRAPVFETYGSREFMLMGAECSAHQGLHMTTEHLLLEVLDDAGRPVAAGVEGNVVVTDLTNRGMPFIRYANGDRAVLQAGSCGCGRGLPLLAAIVGRQLDVLQTPDGGRLPGEFFPHLLKELPAVQRFQVVQERLTHVQLRLVAPNWSAADDAWIRRELTAVAPSLILEIELVADIPLTAAGKLQVVINRLASRPEAP